MLSPFSQYYNVSFNQCNKMRKMNQTIWIGERETKLKSKNTDCQTQQQNNKPI